MANSSDCAGFPNEERHIADATSNSDIQGEVKPQGKPKKEIKLQLGSSKYAGLIREVEGLFAQNLPLDEIAKQSGIAMKQALKILGALQAEHRVDYRPPYAILPVKTVIARLFSKFDVDFNEVKAVYNGDGSITVIPIRSA